MFVRAYGAVALSPDVYREIAQVLNRPKFAGSIGSNRQNAILELLSATAIWVCPIVRVTDCRDSKDNIYLELALAVGADAIVSGDQDLLILDPWREVRILLSADFLAWAVSQGRV